MPGTRLSDIQHHVSQLYDAGEYRPGYDLMLEAGDRFPDDLHEIHYWCICLASMMGASDAALDLLEIEVQQGSWYSKKQLLEESDLVSLQGLARFELLAGECLLRQRIAQADAKAELFVQEPSGFEATSGKPPVLLALHGNSQNGRQTLETWSAITRHGYRLAVVQSSQIVSNGAYSWNDWDLAARDLDHFVPALVASGGLDQMLIGGFSMGAGLAIWQALAGTDYHPRGFIAVGTYFPDVDVLLPYLKQRAGGPLRGYFIIGDQDAPCYEITCEVVHQFEAHDLPCYLEVHPGGVHDYPPDFAGALTRALDFMHAA